MRRPRLRGEEGFVLTIVIFAVAALSIAGTALFLVVQSENAMANSGAESSRALHLASAGLSRYMGESFGDPDPEVTYEMAGGTVTVTSSRLMASGDTADIYLLRADAAIPDRRVRNLVSRRSVQQFALLERRPFRPVAGFALAASNVRTRNVTIDGRDQCATPGSAVGGIVTLANGDIRGTFGGSPGVSTATYTELMRNIGLDWAAMTDHAFGFDYEIPSQSWPRFGFGALAAADAFPTVRVNGDLRAQDTNSGRGLLVVTGNIEFYDDFRWDGAIVAGSMSGSHAQFTVNGTLLAGFNGAQSSMSIHNAEIRYNSCNVAAAAAGIAMFSPIQNTWWESEP